MADQGILRARSFWIGGIKQVNTVDEHTSSEVTREYEASKGGRAGTRKNVTGYAISDGTLKLGEMSILIARSLGISRGSNLVFMVMDSYERPDGSKYTKKEFITAEIEKVTDSSPTIGSKDEVTVTYMPTAIRKLVGAVQVMKMDVDANIYDLGDGDEMEEHRRNTGSF